MELNLVLLYAYLYYMQVKLHFNKYPYGEEYYILWVILEHGSFQDILLHLQGCLI